MLVDLFPSNKSVESQRSVGTLRLPVICLSALFYFSVKHVPPTRLRFHLLKFTIFFKLLTASPVAQHGTFKIYRFPSLRVCLRQSTLYRWLLQRLFTNNARTRQKGFSYNTYFVET